jgi:arsenate reductase-like glutaredoxin family protein
MIENQPNEVTLIYHSDKENDQKSRGYVESLDGYVIKTLDLKNEKLTETQLAEVANKLGATIDELVDESYADRVNIGSVKGLREQDALKLLANDPILINTPIVIIGKHAFHVDSAYELIREGMSEEGVRENSAANVEERKD